MTIYAIPSPVVIEDLDAPRQIGKGEGYLHGIHCLPYDLHGMLCAVGPDFLRHMIDRIMAGDVDCRLYVQRWAAEHNMKTFEVNGGFVPPLPPKAKKAKKPAKSKRKAR